MKKKEIFNKDFLPNRQEKLFLYDQYFKLFIKLYKNNLLPNNILLSGQAGLGKSTFAYHFINSILRIANRKIINRYDKFKKSFYKKVQNGFLKIYNKNKSKYMIIDSSNKFETNQAIIFNQVKKLIQ